jgi:hypothetical protein
MRKKIDAREYAARKDRHACSRNMQGVFLDFLSLLACGQDVKYDSAILK